MKNEFMLGGRVYMKPKKLHWCHNCNEERRMTKPEIEFHQVGQCEIEKYKKQREENETI